MANNGEELSKAEVLDGHCFQDTPCLKRKLEIVIDLVSPGDWILRVGLGTEAGRGWEVATGLAADLGWVDLELFLVVGLVVVGLACGCGGGAVAGGTALGVAEVVGLVPVLATTPPPAAAATREELDGEVGGVDLHWAGEVEVAPWADLSTSMGVAIVAGIASAAAV